MDTSQIRLRPEKGSDLKFVRNLFAQTRVDVTFSALPPEQKQQFIEMQFNAQREHYRTRVPNPEFLIVEYEGRRIGRLYLSRPGDELRVVDITIDGQFRGQGAGKTLLRALQAEARMSGIPVTLHAEKHGNMVEYYKTLDFEVIEEKTAHFFMKWTASSSVITS